MPLPLGPLDELCPDDDELRPDEPLRVSLELPESEPELEPDPAESGDALAPPEPMPGARDPELTGGTGDVGTLALGTWTAGGDTDGGAGVGTDGVLTVGADGVLTVGVDNEGAPTDLVTEGALTVGTAPLVTEETVTASLTGAAAAASVMTAAATAAARRRPARIKAMPLAMCVKARVPVISVVLSSADRVLD